MSGVHFWGLWPLFLLQLPWLLVPEARPLRRTQDTNPLTSGSLGLTKPRPLGQQTLPSEFVSFEEEASALPEYAPEEVEPAPTLTPEAPEKHLAADPQNFASTRPPTWQKGPVLDLGVTVTQDPAVGATPPADLPLSTAPPEHPEVMSAHPEPAHPQPLRTATAQSLGLGVAVTQDPGGEAKPTVGLPLSAAPPEHPGATPSHPEPVQARQPTLGWEVSGSPQPESTEALPPLTPTVDICELCACEGQTLSCADLGPEQKLHRVPVLDPNTNSRTFTTLNLTGNEISHINKESWKSFRQVETLILSVNNVKELTKESLVGLPHLKYLDLSCNKISHIDRNAFEETPFLESINLGCNFITKLDIGTFQAWHELQFLHKIMLDHNPLTTIEDPYFFKLPTVKYLDLGRTQVSFISVQRILVGIRELKKLILPRTLSCCLCQFKKNIEAVSKTVTLQCDSECPCDEQLSTGDAGGLFMHVLRKRNRKISTELTIEPDETPPDKSGNNLSALMSFLNKMISNQQNAKVPKTDWDVGQWEKERTAVEEDEEEESSELRHEQQSGYAHDKALVIRVLIAEAAVACILLFLFIVICCTPSSESKEGNSRILPRTLSCCLCQFKKNIEAVSKKVTLQCDSECPCDEQLSTGDAGGLFMHVLRKRNRKISTELTIEPDETPPDKSGNNLSALMSFLNKMISNQQNAKVPKTDWDVGQWEKERTAVEEDEEEESSELRHEQQSGYANDKALIIGVLIAEAAVACILLFLFIVICCTPSSESKEGNSRERSELSASTGKIVSSDSGAQENE